MTFSWSFGQKFSVEFGRWPTDQQQSVVQFLDVYELHGLSDFTKYVGKLAPSWTGLLASDHDYAYTRENHLWHYHLGIPHYIQVHPRYKTSDFVLHFQWPDKGNWIHLVDVCHHHKWTGEFYLPSPEYLTPQEASASVTEPAAAPATAG